MPAEQFRFHLPNLPKPIWKKFQEIRKSLGLKQRQCLILGILAICEIGDENPEKVEKMANEIKEKEEYI